MIKITSFSGGYCKLLFEVEPTRPANIHEPELGKAVAKDSPNYCIEEGKIYRVIDSIDMECSIKKLYETQKDVQEEFSKKIHDLKKSLDKFKLLQEFAKKEKVKK